MNKNILDKIFRKDLNLKNKWWHRFLSVTFVFLFILFVGDNIIYFSVHDMFRGGQVQQWNKVGTLSERINSEIRPVSSFLKVGEKIGENDRTYVLNNQPDEYYKGILNDVYCSTEPSNNYEKVKISRNIDELYVRGLYGRNKVPVETFLNYIKQNGIKCLIVDYYTAPDDLKITFLEPDRSYQDNWSFFEKSTTKTVLYFFEMIPIILGISFVVFIVILAIYYKIILYIIFGNKKNTE